MISTNGVGRRSLSRSVTVVLAILALVPAGCAPGPPAAPPVELVETVPVESQIGNPSLPAALDVWLEMIRGAKRNLDFEAFYLSHWPGEPLEEVLDAIGEAAARGVRVRVLLDKRMHGTYPEPADSLARVPGIEVRRIDMRRIAGGTQHAKFFLVDDDQIFLGSQNLDWRALKHIHELGVRIRDGRTAAAFRDVFEMDWAAAEERGGPGTAPSLRPHQSIAELPILIIQSPSDTVALWPSYSPRSFIPDTTRWDLEAIVRLIEGARSEIVIQLLSYALGEDERRDDTLDGALRRAAARGVRVKLLVSDWQADGPRIAALQSLSNVAHIEARLAVIPEWSGGYIPFARVDHCKYMVVDTVRTWLGTSNWGPGYFHGSRNVAVTLANRPLAEQARQVFETGWRAPGVVRVRADTSYAPRVHGMDPPPGQPAYGT